MHSGILQCARNVLKIVEPTVKKAMKEGQIKRVVCTGHSLGAACAALLALELVEQHGHKKVQCWAFAPPAILSPSVAYAADTRKVIRSVTCADDLVPRATAESLLKVQRTLVHLLDKIEGPVDAESADNAADKDDTSSRSLAGAARRVLRLWALVNDTDDKEDGQSSGLLAQLEKKAGKSMRELAPPPSLRSELLQILAEVDDEKDRRR